MTQPACVIFQFADREKDKITLWSLRDFRPYRHSLVAIDEWARQFEKLTRTPNWETDATRRRLLHVESVLKAYARATESTNCRRQHPQSALGDHERRSNRLEPDRRRHLRRRVPDAAANPPAGVVVRGDDGVSEVNVSDGNNHSRSRPMASKDAPDDATATTATVTGVPLATVTLGSKTPTVPGTGSTTIVIAEAGPAQRMTREIRQRRENRFHNDHLK